MKYAYRLAIGATAVLTVLVFWQLGAAVGWTDPVFLPSPVELVRTTLDLASHGYQQISLWHHIGVSLLRALSAFAASIVIGVPLGLLMGLTPALSAALDPFVQFLRPLPKIALIPLTVVWFGIGESSKFFLIFISCFLSVVVGAAAAVGSVSRARMLAGQTLGASRYQIFRHVVLPNALPEIFTSVRLSIGIGWTSLIAAELVAASSGLGWMVMNSGTYLRTDVVMVGILLLGLIGYLLDYAIVIAQRVMVPWAGREA
ncbi:ABC transporter permease [Pandoraea sputorum]|uniref:ABC transporter permease n=1 Tax=Pandoraea sputorum TaxID=93222 RepID=UPI00123F405F|nr:ABC transporter permease [Pandoraea sputorum]VVE78550.1 taurine ABC transporter permease [Pandoraea sputorum]